MESVTDTGRGFALALGLTALITPLAVHLFFPVIPAVKVALGLSDAYAYLTFSIALFGMAFATLFYGSLSDRYGRRPVLLSGLAAVPGRQRRYRPWRETASTLVLGRLVQAIGAGCGLALVRAIARDAYRAEQLVKAIAYLTMFGTLGPDGVAVHRRRADRHVRLAQRVRLRAAGGRRHHADRLSGDVRNASGRPTAPSGDVSVAQSYAALFRRLRFNAFVLQSGFATGAFMVMASASASLMTELLHRPATEFGLYFMHVSDRLLHRQLHLQPDRQPGRGRDHGADRLAAGAGDRRRCRPSCWRTAC